MFVCLDGKGSYSSLRRPAESVRARKKLIQVPTSDLNSYVHHNNIKNIDFIKIDVEGGELDVLKGGLGILNRLHPVIMCELADIRTRQWGYMASDIFSLLRRYGYTGFRITPNSTLKFAEQKEKYEPDWENLIMVPKQKLKEISNFVEGS